MLQHNQIDAFLTATHPIEQLLEVPEESDTGPVSVAPPTTVPVGVSNLEEDLLNQLSPLRKALTNGSSPNAALTELGREQAFSFGAYSRGGVCELRVESVLRDVKVLGVPAAATPRPAVVEYVRFTGNGAAELCGEVGDDLGKLPTTMDSGFSMQYRRDSAQARDLGQNHNFGEKSLELFNTVSISVRELEGKIAFAEFAKTKTPKDIVVMEDRIGFGSGVSGCLFETALTPNPNKPLRFNEKPEKALYMLFEDDAEKKCSSEEVLEAIKASTKKFAILQRSALVELPDQLQTLIEGKEVPGSASSRQSTDDAASTHFREEGLCKYRVRLTLISKPPSFAAGTSSASAETDTKLSRTVKLAIPVPTTADGML